MRLGVGWVLVIIVRLGAQVHSVSSEQFGWPGKKRKRASEGAGEADICREMDWR